MISLHPTSSDLQETINRNWDDWQRSGPQPGGALKIEARCSLCKCNSYITLKGGSCLRYQVRDDFSTLVIATPVTRRRFSIVPRSSICGRRSRRASHLGDTTCCRCDQPRESNIGTSEGWLRACPNRVKINFALVWEIQVTVSPSVCLLRSVVSNICSFFFFTQKSCLLDYRVNQLLHFSFPFWRLPNDFSALF